MPTIEDIGEPGPTNMANVLDHGIVRLVDNMGSDLSIVRAARVSHNADWRTGDDAGKDAKLIRFLWQNFHSTPFEVVSFTFEVCAPIFVFRQWHRHRTWTYNEVSARYTQLPDMWYLPRPEDVGMQDGKNKQGRTFMAWGSADYQIAADQLLKYDAHCEECFKRYHIAITDWKWPRELARCFLPLSTYSRMFGTVNLLNLFRFLDRRADDHAQMEIRVYAEAMLELIRPICPIAVEAYEEFKHGR